MTTTVDFDALQAARGPRVTILRGQDVDRSGSGGDFTDFSVASSVYIEVLAVRRADPLAAGTLTVTVEHSDDGLSWSTAHEFDFSSDGRLAASVSSPKAHWRASWTVGGASQWRIVEVVVTPTTIDSSQGGGSVPDSWILLTGNALTANGALTLSESDHAGSDLALNADNQHIDFLTAGTYVVYAQVPISGDATGAGAASVQASGTLLNNAWGNFGNPFLVRSKVIPASFAEIVTLTLPPITIAAPCDLEFAVAIAASAGAITVGGNGTNDNYVVQRIA